MHGLGFCDFSQHLPSLPGSHQQRPFVAAGRARIHGAPFGDLFREHRPRARFIIGFIVPDC